MRKLIPISLLIVPVLLVAGTKTSTKSAAPAAAAPTHVATTAAAIQWGDVPPTLPAGAKLAVLEGDPSKQAYFVIRLKGADGYRVGPHWHPTREHITVITGTFHIGMGDTIDTAKADALPAGSFAYMGAKMHHYAWFEGATEVQIEGMGPFVINYVNPKDDPSKASAKSTK